MAAVGDVYRVSIVGTHFGEQIVNTLYYQISTVGTGDERSALATGLAAAGIPGSYGNAVSSDYAGVAVNVQAVKPVGPTLVVGPLITAGTGPTPSFPSQVSAIMVRKTALGGKGNRGRLFMPAVPTTFFTANVITTAGTAAYQALRNSLLNNVTGSGWTFIPVHFRKKILTAIIITTFSITSNPKTRRSRGFNTRFHRRRKHLVGSI